MFPIVIERPLVGKNGTNWPGLVVMHPDCPLPAAVLAQEWREAMFKLNPVNLIATRLSKRALRRMEVMGHATEVAAEVLIYGGDEGAAMDREIEAMRRGYGGLFADVPVVPLKYALTAAQPKARRWVKARQKRLERWK